MRNLLLVMTIVFGSLLAVSCGSEPAPAPTEALPDSTPIPAPETAATEEPFESPLNMPNPASRFCRDQGYQLEMRTDASGTTGYCVFPDGSECEEWAFYRGECGPADTTFDSPVGLPNPASQYCQEQGYDLEMRTDAAGTAGYCIFPDGTECEEWAFYRGECAPGTPAP
jgi:putative hemolysin